MRGCQLLYIVASCFNGLSVSSFGFRILVAKQRPSPVACQATFTQVISDVDDTLKSSGGVQVAGVYLGGVDVQYKRGAYYPGVAEFLLYLGKKQTKLAILTARAEEFKALLELKPDSPLALALKKAGETAGVPGWGIGPVLYGSAVEWIAQDRKGWRKFINFERLIEQDTSGKRLMKYIYVGDTGELDEEAGAAILREYSDIVKAVFLHVVSDQPGPVTVSPTRFINGRPVVYFRTYVGAALAAVELGLMDKDALKFVINAAYEQLLMTEEPKDSDKWLDLELDVERARGLTQTKSWLR